MKELVSVIIPVYKVEEYLNQCVDSVLNQTYEELEIILVDDGSPDNCPKICDAYKLIDSRIIVIHKENGGQGTARNLALDICRGQYIAFLDSDDYWESTYIETLLNEMNLYNADIAICNYNHVNENGRVLKNGPRSRISHKVYTGTEAMEVALYWREFGVAPWAKLYRREIWKNVRYNEDRIYEDLATTYKVYFEAQKVVFILYKVIVYFVYKIHIAVVGLRQMSGNQQKRVSVVIKYAFGQVFSVCNRSDGEIVYRRFISLFLHPCLGVDECPCAVGRAIVDGEFLLLSVFLIDESRFVSRHLFPFRYCHSLGYVRANVIRAEVEYRQIAYGIYRVADNE